jgi:hypothetical protein
MAAAAQDLIHGLTREQEGQLVGLLQIAFDKSDNIDDIIERAKGNTTRLWPESELVALFDQQIQRLQVGGAGMCVTRWLLQLKDRVIAEASITPFRRCDTPFLPVSPIGTHLGVHLTLPEMLAMAKYRGNSGRARSTTDLSKLISLADPPAESYYLFDVHDGRDTLNMKSDEARQFIEEAHCFAVDVAEGVSVVMHTNVLETVQMVRFLQSTGETDYEMPQISVHHLEQRPYLNAFGTKNAAPEAGYPYYRRRIVVEH